MRLELLSLAVLLLFAAGPEPTAAQPEASPSSAEWIKVYVTESGAYRISLAEIRALLSPHQALTSEILEISHHGRRLPQWLDLEGTGNEGYLIFVVPSFVFEFENRHQESRLAALRLEIASETSLPSWSGVADDVVPRDRVTQVLRLEEDRLLAPMTSEPSWQSPSLWQWALLSQRSSSELRMRTPVPTSPGSSLNLRVGLLGWSLPGRGLDAHHAVSVSLDGVAVGKASWDGRLPFELQLQGLVRADVESTDGSLELLIKVPRRTDDSGREIVDLSYVDWIEFDFALPDEPITSQRTVEISATAKQARRWVASAPPRLAGEASATRLYLGTETQEEGVFEGFAASREQLLAPLDLAAVHSSSLDEDEKPEAEYVLVAPPHFLAQAERLAALHQARGIETLVVDAHKIFDELGDGLRRPQPLRDYLLERHRQHEALRWVLLVGDADWFAPDERPLEDVDSHRNLLPSWTFLSRHGPAVSDHYYAVEDASETTPRFAVGRLPVATNEELDGVIDKIERYLASPRPGDRSALLLGSLDAPSQGRLRRLRRNWQPEGQGKSYQLRELERAPETELDDALTSAWNLEPTIVFFSGHGSRHLWRLGAVDDQRPETLWSQEEAATTAPSERPPAVVSLSCATAPFDHPNNSSLGEALVLEPTGGAIGFFGASATLYTRPRFGERLLSELTAGRTLGESLVEAKRHASDERLSHLYNLLGDPALILD